MHGLKIAALLHDTPDKPWLMVGGESHEEEARRRLKELAGLEGIDRRVREADRLAARIDRYALSIVMGEGYERGFAPSRELVLKNPINPLFRVELPRSLSRERVESFWSELRGALEGLGSDAEKYTVLYALYETLWIRRGLPVGPADTRVPTHTVFDHDYATAAAVNWVLGGGVEGLLIGLDAAGVQGFVSSSRKLRDAWVSSYVVSALVWYTILPLVEKWGPDVVVTPSLRFNHFFFHWLLRRVRGSGAERVLEEVMRSCAYLGDEHLWSLYKDLGMPPYACVPERATLILPPKPYDEPCDVAARLEQRFEEGWRRLWDAARRYAQLRAGQLLWELVRRTFEEYEREWREAGFHEVAPLALRVEVVEVKSKSLDWEIYDKKYRELAERLSMRKYVRLEPESRLRLVPLTERAFRGGLGFPRRSRRGFEYCTSCGKLPALLVLPSGEGGSPAEEEYGFYLYGALEKGWEADLIREKWREVREAAAQRELEEFEGWLRDHALELQGTKTIFTPGERLCAWCFLKRVLGLEPRLLNVLLLDLRDSKLDEFLSECAESRVRFGFPSTADVASLRLREELVGLPRRSPRRAGELRGWLDRLHHGPFGGAVLELLRAAVAEARPWRAERELEEAVGRLDLDEGQRTLLRGLLKADPEVLWFTSEAGARRWWRSLLRELGLSRLLQTYYCLLLADGDNIGGLLEGRLSALCCAEVSGELAARIVEAWGEGGFQEHLVDELKRGRGPLASVLSELRVPVSLAYHSSISSALSRAAVVDAAVISALGGFVVYAGGDDLLAFAPVDAAPAIVRASRRLFAGAPVSEPGSPEAERGFIRLGEAWLPALPGVGRSYCALVVHFMHPLHLSIRRAASALKEAKSSAWAELWSGGVRERLTKDGAIFVYVPRGGGESAFVPQTLLRVGRDEIDSYLKEVAATIEAVEELLRAVAPLRDRPACSTSLLYDVEEVDGLLVAAARSNEADIAERLVGTVLRRNSLRGATGCARVLGRIAGKRRLSCVVGREGEARPTHLFTSLVRAVRLLRGGAR